MSRNLDGPSKMKSAAIAADARQYFKCLKAGDLEAAKAIEEKLSFKTVAGALVYFSQSCRRMAKDVGRDGFSSRDF